MGRNPLPTLFVWRVMDERAKRIRDAAREALSFGADRRLADRISGAPEGFPLDALEKRFQALLDTVEDDLARRHLADLVWGGWDSRIVRVGMSEAEWQRVLAAVQKLPGRSQAERLGKLLLLGATLVEEEGPRALARLL